MSGITLQHAEELFKESADKLQEMAMELRYTCCELSCKHCNKHYLEHILGNFKISVPRDGSRILVLQRGDER